MTERLIHNKLTWININNPTPDDLEDLKLKYDFHDLDLEDCRSKVQRPKFEDYEEYKFFVLHFPVHHHGNYRLGMEEIDIFWGKDYLVTLHTNRLPKMNELFHLAQSNQDIQDLYFSKGCDYLLYKILHEMTLTIFPFMTQISLEIDYLDTHFTSVKPSKVIERISALRRNIIFLQTSLKPQRAIFLIFENQLADQEEKDMDIYWGDIGDYIGKVLDMAEDYQELTEGLYSSIDTLLTFRMNTIMKTLTIFSVIMLPLTFITGFFGMNIKLPLQDLVPDTLMASGILFGVMGIIALVMILFFKIRKF
jgi:magnesium transporter